MIASGPVMDLPILLDQCSQMHTSSKIAETKVSYLVLDGLGPYFHKEIVDDIEVTNSL